MSKKSKTAIRVVILTVVGIAVSVVIFKMFEYKSQMEHSTDRTVKQELPTCKIGAILALSGKASWLGRPELNTLEMLTKKVNSSGGIGGYRIELVVEDSCGDENMARLGVKKLVGLHDNLLAIIGPSRSGTTMAIIPIVEEARIPLISCAAAEVIVNPVKKWVFKTPQTDLLAVCKIYKDIQERKITKVGVITGETGFGQAGRDHLIKTAGTYNVRIVADEIYPSAVLDMKSQLVRIRNQGAEAVINWSIVPAQSIVANNMQELGIDIPLYQSHGFGNIKYLKLINPGAADKIRFPCGRLLCVDSLPDEHPQKKVLQKYRAEYEQAYAEPVTTFGGYAHDALMLVFDALEHCGPDKNRIRDYLENRKGFVGTTGIFNFSPLDHNGLDLSSFPLLGVRDNQFVLIED